jgi:hypothetical protein
MTGYDLNIRPLPEAARTSETSVNIDLTIRQYIPEDSEFKGFVCFFILRSLKLVAFEVLKNWFYT